MPNLMYRLAIDFNERSGSGFVRGALGHLAAVLNVDDWIVVFDPHEAMMAEAQVVDIAVDQDFVLLDVSWDTVANDRSPFVVSADGGVVGGTIYTSRNSMVIQAASDAAGSQWELEYGSYRTTTESVTASV